MKKRHAAVSSQRLVLIVGAAIIAVFAAVVVYAFNTMQGTPTQQPLTRVATTPSPSPVAEAYYEQDSDNDGLADWEELLWSTDQALADTDGDGVSDGEEVAVGTNPLDPTPPEEFEESESGDTLSAPRPDTSTDIIGKELFSGYMLTFQQGRQPTVQEQQEIVDNAIRATLPSLQAPTYTTNQVVVVGVSEASREKYARTILEAFADMLTTPENEMELLYQIAIGNRDPQIAERIDETAAYYTNKAEELFDAPVPSDAVAIHHELVNALLRYAHAVSGFGDIYTDPLRAAASLQLFDPYNIALNRALKKFYTYASTHSPQVFSDTSLNM